MGSSFPSGKRDDPPHSPFPSDRPIPSPSSSSHLHTNLGDLGELDGLLRDVFLRNEHRYISNRIDNSFSSDNISTHHFDDR